MNSIYHSVYKILPLDPNVGQLTPPYIFIIELFRMYTDIIVLFITIYYEAFQAVFSHQVIHIFIVLSLLISLSCKKVKVMVVYGSYSTAALRHIVFLPE